MLILKNELDKEREEIAGIIRQNEVLSSAYENGNIYVSSNYFNYMVYLFVAIFLFMLLIKTGISSDGGIFNFFLYMIGILSIVIIFSALLLQN